MNYRKKEKFAVVQLPEFSVDENRGKRCNKCCSNQLVLAHETENESYKNDFTGVYVKKGLPGDVITFDLISHCTGDVVTSYGVDAIFPNDSLAVGYIFDWKQILINHGIGTYKIQVNFSIAGVTGDYIHSVYDLKEFNVRTAKDSVRIYSEFNSYFLKDNVDFTDSNFKDTIRFNGFFGHRQPQTDINNLIDKGRKVVKVTRENVNQYTLNTDPIEDGMSKQLLDFHLLNEDVLKISDHNTWNHSYQFFDKEVELASEPKTTPIDFDRRIYISVTFGDRKLVDKSYYRTT